MFQAVFLDINKRKGVYSKYQLLKGYNAVKIQEQYEAAGVVHTDDTTCPVCTGTPFNPTVRLTHLLAGDVIYPLEGSPNAQYV